MGDIVLSGGTSSGGGGGAATSVSINDGVDTSIKATVFDRTNSNPIAVELVDTNGDPISVGGGTQYAEDTPSTAGELLTMAGVVRSDAGGSLVDTDGDRTELQVNSFGALRVDASSATVPVFIGQGSVPVRFVGTATANGSGVGGGIGSVAGSNLVITQGAEVCAVFLSNTGAFNGTVKVRGDVNGTDAYIDQIYDQTNNAVVTSIPLNAICVFPCGGLSDVSLYVSAWTSGTFDFEMGAGVGTLNMPKGTQNVAITAGSAVIGHVITDVGSVTNVNNAAGASAVNIQDGGNSITTDSLAEGATADAAVITDVAGTISGKLRGLVKWAFERMPASLGQKTMALSLPVVLASNQTDIPITAGTTNLSTLVALENSGNLETIAINSGSISLSASSLLTGQQNRSQKTQITDGTRDGTVKAASTLPVATDTALVVTQRDALPAGSIISTKVDLTPSAPTVATVGVASAQAVAAAATRKGLILRNLSTTGQRISLGFGQTAILDNGVTLYPQDAFNMGEYDFDLGAVNAIASAASASLAIQQYLT